MVCATAELFSDHVTLYNDDLPSPRSFNAELDRWIHRWSVIDPTERPKTILLALKECPPEYYPNIRALLEMFVVLPVSVAECERSFSALKRLKTPLRSLIGQDRLVGLSLMYIHSEICISPEVLAQRFLAQPNRRVVK